MFAYDARGNKTAEFNANRDSATWTYDDFGRVTTHKDLGGAVTNYRYNKTGQLLTHTNDRGQNLAYGYYENGSLKTITDTGAPPVTLIGSGGVLVTGTTVTKTGSAGWGNADVHSQWSDKGSESN